MTILSTCPTARLCNISALCCLIVALSNSVAFAQAGPNAAQTFPEKDQTQPGTCKPIGMTASGELVFPLDCWDFVARQKFLGLRFAPSQSNLPFASDSQPLATETRPILKDTKSKEERSAADVGRSVEQVEEPTGSNQTPAANQTMPLVTGKQTATDDGRLSAAETKPVTPEQQPTHEQTEPLLSNVAIPESDEPATMPAEKAALPRQVENRSRERVKGLPQCVHFRSYDSASGTYRDFTGRTRLCQ
jgi:hypothetical protein